MNKEEQNRVVFDFLTDEIVEENWIKPPKFVQYKNAKLIDFDGSTNICGFFFPEKYYKKDFFLLGKKVLSSSEMYFGKRYFYSDRFYSLLEFYSDTGKLVGYYFDIALPAIVFRNKVLITDIKLDIYVLPDKRNFFLLDQDEYNEAVRNKMFSKEEIEVADRTVDFIINSIYRNEFDKIFTDYERATHKNWIRYNEYNKILYL